MRIIPVLDLKGGVAVHAVRGRRDAYAPVRSVLAASADPLALARAFKERLGVHDCYVADLDAIAGSQGHGPTIRAIADLGLAVWLDAGVGTVGGAAQALAHGASRVIIGTETLPDRDVLPALIAATGPHTAGQDPRCVLSIDLLDGQLLGGSPVVARLGPAELALAAWQAGFRSFIVLDLARVGTGEGPETRAALELRRALPGAEIIVGGGVRDAADLRALGRQGFDAVLVASALHAGTITPGLVDPA